MTTATPHVVSSSKHRVAQSRHEPTSGRLRPLILAVSLLFGVACSATKNLDTVPQQSSLPRIHVYAAPASGSDGSVNSYFVETEHGVVVIDGLRSLHEARAGLVELQKLGKPLLAVVLTHPHPDHVGGLGVFAAAGASSTPVYGSDASKKEILDDPHGYYKLSVSTMPGDFPEHATYPTQLTHDGQHVAIDGVDFAFFELGAAEAVSSTVVVVPSAKAAFVGDVTSEHMMPYLVEGRSRAWLAQLDKLTSVLTGVDRVYPGHGHDSLVSDAIDQQQAYLTTFRALISQQRSPAGITAQGRAAITAGMTSSFADYPPVATVPDLFNKNIDAVAAELASE